MKVSVVIPQYNGWAMTHSLLFDLFTYCKGIDEILLVDNGSTEKDGRDWWLTNKMLPLRVERLEENIGFLKAANYGMSKATGGLLVLISNDVRIQEDIVERIELLASYQKNVVGGRLINWDSGWNAFDGRIFPYLEGYLLACENWIWKSTGGFDEQFYPNDFEDVDWSTTCINQGFTLVGLESEKITHFSGKTIGYSSEREALTKINQEKFRQKWLKGENK